MKIYEALKAYKVLLDTGAITPEEFESKKKELLGTFDEGGKENLPLQKPENKDALLDKKIADNEAEKNALKIELEKEKNKANKLQNEINKKEEKEIIRKKNRNICKIILSIVRNILSILCLLALIRNQSFCLMYGYNRYMIANAISFLLLAITINPTPYRILWRYINAGTVNKIVMPIILPIIIILLRIFVVF